MNTLIVHPAYGYRRHEEVIREHCARNGITLIHYIYTTLAFAAQASPSLFAMNESGIPHRSRLECETRLCPSNREALNLFREGARRYLGERVRPGDHLMLATPDGRMLCRCPKCSPLNSVEQWQPMLEIAVEEIQRCGKSLRIHFLSYIGRFALPKDMGIFRHIDGVMFDTHLRYRWKPMGCDHPIGPLEEDEARDDPRAGIIPINRYLYDRLIEWRSAFSGKLYVFENLMIQGCFSLPQPNTGILLQDQQIFRNIGVDGVIYEAFEPGMPAFEDQLEELARGMSGDPVNHVATPLELLCEEEALPITPRLRVLSYLFADALRTEQALRHYLPSPEHAHLARSIRDYLENPSLARWRAIATLVRRHPDKFDWIYISYRLATYLPPSERPILMTKDQEKMFETPKPWDFLEPLDDPHSSMAAVFASLIASASGEP